MRAELAGVLKGASLATAGSVFLGLSVVAYLDRGDLVGAVAFAAVSVVALGWWRWMGYRAGGGGQDPE